MTIPRLNTLAQDDPLGYRHEFEEAISEPELAPFYEGREVGPEARCAAYELAAALGNCRLFGVNFGQADGILSPGIATAAAEELLHHLARWTEDACQLSQRWDQAHDPVQAEQMCFDLLEVRMEAWAAFVAIDEAYSDCLVANDLALRGFGPLMEGLVEALPAFDRALRAQKPLLAVASETNMLRNWRAMLAAPYADVLPWWLDGRLEQVAEGVIARALASQPQRLPSGVASTMSVELAREPGTTRDASAEYAMAAGATEDDHALLNRLAVDAPPAGMDDYRRAWAHFLACCYLGTSGSPKWREAFLKATATVESLSDDWKQRVQRVQDLSAYHDWERRCLDGLVFTLEPRTLNTPDDLVRWLDELTSSSTSN